MEKQEQTPKVQQTNEPINYWNKNLIFGQEMADKQQADTYKTDYGQVKSCNSHNRDNVKDAKSIERMS